MIRRLTAGTVVLCVQALLACTSAHAGNLLQNGGFETVRQAEGPLSSDIGFGVWRAGETKLAPAVWTPNPAYPGTLEAISEGAPEGTNYLRLRADGQRGQAHMYQPCAGIKPGSAYVLSARVRGGPVTLGVYEYHEDGRILTPGILAAPRTEDWREVSGYYFAPREGLRSVSVAMMLSDKLAVDIDDVRVEEAPDMTRPDDLQPVVLESDRLKVVLSPEGTLEEFTCKATGVNYAQPGPKTPVFVIKHGGAEVPVHYVRRQGGVLDVQFARPGLRATFKYESHAQYFTLALRSVSSPDAEWVQLCRFPLSIAEHVGTLINAAWNDGFSACVLGCNDFTDSFGANGSRADLVARCHGQFGLVGAKVAVVGVPLDPPGSTDRLLDAIERVELDQGLPHPTINGVWIKRAPERFSSYLMAYGVSEGNIDDVVEFAQGGFGCVELLNWWHSTPTYAPSPSLYPNGLAGMKACADKIHAAGMEVGLHAMQAMVGWGGIGLRDPYVSPVADPRLLRTREAPLAGDLAADATEIAVEGDLSEWPERGDLFVDGELVRYVRRDGSRFLECQRGLHGTTTQAHMAGTPVGLMKNCFSIWDHVIYAPRADSTMVDEVCANIARVFNAVGADMTYFDGGEEIAVQPPHWRNQGRVALGVFDRLDEAVILEGNALYTHSAWHVITRGSPSYDPIYYGRRDYTLRNKGQNPGRWASNLLTGDVGWFQAHTHSRSTYAVTPDEMQLLCLKAVGGRAPISFIVSAGNLYANKRMPEMLEIIRTCDRLKREASLSREALAELSRPWAEHSLTKTQDGHWQICPMKMDWPRMVSGGDEGKFTFANPHGPQRPWLQLRAQSRLAQFGAEGNVVLTDGAGLTVNGSASPELAASAQPSTETAPDGSAAFAFSARNAGANTSGWCRASQPFEPFRDLSRHRRLGLWVRAEGKGGVLNVQLASRHSFRDHYIDLDYEGWRYHVLATGETSRFYDYKWPHAWVDLMYRGFNYSAVEGINLLYNALPAGAEVSCLVSRVEALQEADVPLVSPALEVGAEKVAFPVSLLPDEYIEVGWDGVCRHFEPNGGLLGQVVPEGSVTLPAGDAQVRFSCETRDGLSPRAEVTLATRGAPLAEGVQAPEPVDGAHVGLQLTPGAGAGPRVLDGLYERVSRQPARAVSAFDGAANVWTVSNASPASRPAALVFDYTRAENQPVPDDATATPISAFGDLSAYEMSEANRYADYVQGGGRQLTESGPVREGVTQSFAACAEGRAPGAPCVEFGASNALGPGGWCGKGMRFEPLLDLSAQKLLAMWVHGDGAGELLKIQFRDAEGNWRDWNVTVSFAGWQRQAYRIDRAPGFDWAKVEYIIFYYNDIPSGRAVTVRLAELVAATDGLSPGKLTAPRIIVNGERISLADSLDPGTALALDAQGNLCLWKPGSKRSEPAGKANAGAVLTPGENRLELQCANAPAGEFSGLSVTVVPM